MVAVVLLVEVGMPARHMMLASLGEGVVAQRYELGSFVVPVALAVPFCIGVRNFVPHSD